MRPVLAINPRTTTEDAAEAVNLPHFPFLFSLFPEMHLAAPSSSPSRYLSFPPPPYAIYSAQRPSMAPAPQSPGFTTPEAIFHSFRISFISQTSKHWRHPRFMNSLLFCLHTAYLGDLSGKGGMWSSAQSSAGGGSLGSQTSKRRLSIKPHEKQCSLAVMALTR